VLMNLENAKRKTLRLERGRGKREISRRGAVAMGGFAKVDKKNFSILDGKIKQESYPFDVRPRGGDGIF